jgi:ketosteroid isomerase-like protein
MAAVPTESLPEFFARWLRTWVARDIPALLDFYADDCTVETPTMGTINGKQALEDAEKKLFINFHDIGFVDTELMAAGNRLVVTATVTGTDLHGTLTRPGAAIRFPAVLIWTTEHGRIIRERRLWDFSGFVLQRVERELNDAAEVQRLLLPPGGFTGDGFEVAASSVPARTIGGDFFDYFQAPNEATGPHTAKPGVALDATNRAMLRRAVPGKFATVVFATLSKDLRLTYSNAGHNPPLLLGRNGAQWLKTGGTFAGMFEGAQFEEETLQLHAGDRLVVYSDGITEARNTEGIEFGEERLLSCVEANREQAPPRLVRSVLDAVQQFATGTRQGDDLTVLVLSCT